MPYIRNKRTGETVFVPDQVAPNRPGAEYQGPAAAAEYQSKVLQNQRLPVQTQGDVIDNSTKAATQAATIAKARADAEAAQAAASQSQMAAQFARTHGGLTRDQWNEGQSGLSQMQALNGSVKKLRDLYNKSFKGVGIGSLAEYLPPSLRPVNGVFNDTANSLLADMAKAKGLTSQQFNTPAEQKMFFQPLIPTASDTDAQIANKIDALQRMVNQGTERFARQVGKRTTGSAPKQQSSSVIDFNHWGQ